MKCDWGTHSEVPVSVNSADFTIIRESKKLDQLDRLVRESYNYDFPEKTTEDKREYSQEDNKFLEKVKTFMKMKNKHYEFPLPFKNYNFVFPDNKAHAIQLLSSLERKLKRNTQFLADYSDFMSKIMDKGYAERVPQSELQQNIGRTWFIPHHGVYHPTRQGKIRVVFDCTATYQGVSLNNCLLQGPDLTNDLLGVFI